MTTSALTVREFEAKGETRVDLLEKGQVEKGSNLFCQRNHIAQVN